MGRKKKDAEAQYQYEAERDYVRRFIAERYVSDGYYIHFHRNIELYGVVRGEVYVTISGESRTLHEGEIAVIDSFESHSYEIEGKAEIFYFHIGSTYIKDILALDPNNRLPRWLADKEKNKPLIQAVNRVINYGDDWSELKRTGFLCVFFADIIEAYGVLPGKQETEQETDLVSRVVQYIYDHYAEEITLKSLSDVFFVSPKTLSRRISKAVNCDLRVFVNDVRVQKAVQLMNMPGNRNEPVGKIAAKCGFTNMVTFYRSYKRNFNYKKLP